MRFFITGISRGLGLALAKECVSRGHEVWGVSRNIVPGLGAEVRHTRCDIGSPLEIDRVFSIMKAEGYAPDVVVLNAAHIDKDSDEGVDSDVLRRTFEVNILGNIRWLNLMQLAGSSKKTVFFNISSASSFRAIPADKLSYSASKSAMDRLFDGLRAYHNRNGLHRFVTLNFGPLKERCAPISLFSKTYLNAAQKIVRIAENGSGRDVLSYPMLAGFAYRMTRVLPDSLVRKVISLYLSRSK